MILVVVAIYKLALKIAHRESGAETCARAFAVGFRSANFDEIGESSASEGGVLCLPGSDRGWQNGNLILFGYQPCQSTMNLCKELLKRKGRGQPNVNPTGADPD